MLNVMHVSTWTPMYSVPCMYRIDVSSNMCDNRAVLMGSIISKLNFWGYERY